MKNSLLTLFLFSAFITNAQLTFYDSIDEIYSSPKTSETIGICCTLNKVAAKITGIENYYVVQAEKNQDSSYSIYFLTAILIGNYDELTQFHNTSAGTVKSFHIANDEKFNRLRELLVLGADGIKASPVKKDLKFVDISEVLEGGKNEGDKLILRIENESIIKNISFQLIDESGMNYSSSGIQVKFINQLFGSNEEID